MSTKLENEFTVPVPIGQAWDVLLDVERVAPCMPGATLESVEGDTLTGRIKVKVGPITVTYKGEARFTETDAEKRRVTVEGSGKEARGSGTASAEVVAALHEEGGSTRVRVDTTLNVTGRVAQFGRGVMADVSAKLITTFADNLAAELRKEHAPEPVQPAEPVEPEAGAPSAAASASPAPSGTSQPVEPARDSADDSLDLLDIAGGPMVKRALPVIAAAAIGAILLGWLRRRKKRR